MVYKAFNNIYNTYKNFAVNLWLLYAQLQYDPKFHVKLIQIVTVYSSWFLQQSLHFYIVAHNAAHVMN